VRAYLLTKDRRYADELVRRVFVMGDWDKNPNVKGDFNSSAILSNASMAYDACHALLTPEQKAAMLDIIKRKGTEMYKRNMNHLENHIADNHVWQMTMRIAAMAAYATKGELPEADEWSEYYYNVWLARFPGLNRDGAWHNGDSYFTVNTRTLVEVPWFYSRVTGYDFFSDPWYDNNIMYTIYNNPPFSKSAGNGSSHLHVNRPNAVRIGYLDALARLRGNTFAADFVRKTLAKEPEYLKKAFPGQAGRPGVVPPAVRQASARRRRPGGSAPRPYLPRERPGLGLQQLGPRGRQRHVELPQLALRLDLARTGQPERLQHLLRRAVRSSTARATTPRLSTCTAIVCHRGSWGHNTILPDGHQQKIGVEGYGWIPRHYNGAGINYVLGDASNAYGKVESPLWLERAKASEIEYSPEYGWDENHVTKYRRHIVDLGSTGWILVYDELEGDRPISWHYRLHAVAEPITYDGHKDMVHVRTTNKTSEGDAYLYSTGKLECDTTSRFAVPATNWLKGDANGKFKKNPDHYHFTAKSEPSQVYRYAALINSHGANHPSVAPKRLKDGSLRAGGWTVTVNLSSEGKPAFSATNADGTVTIAYEGEETVVTENGRQTVLTDQVPDLEI